MVLLTRGIDPVPLETGRKRRARSLPVSPASRRVPAGEIPEVAPGLSEVAVTERALPTNYIRGQFLTPDPGDPDFAAMQVGVRGKHVRRLGEQGSNVVLLDTAAPRFGDGETLFRLATPIPVGPWSQGTRSAAAATY